MKQILLPLLVLLCWQTVNSQQASWLVEATTFPNHQSDFPLGIEPELTCAIDDDFGFHHFSLSQTGTFSSLNGFNNKRLSPYIFISYNPWQSYSYTSFGVSREIMGCVAYVELGISDSEYKNWSVGAGVIYSLELPKLNLRNKRRHPS